MREDFSDYKGFLVDNRANFLAEIYETWFGAWRIDIWIGQFLHTKVNNNILGRGYMSSLHRVGVRVSNFSRMMKKSCWLTNTCTTEVPPLKSYNTFAYSLIV